LRFTSEIFYPGHIQDFELYVLELHVQSFILSLHIKTI